MMLRLIVVNTVLISLGVALSIHAQSPPPKAAKEPSTGTISGKVVNESGQPMAGVAAFVRAVNSTSGGRSAITDADGTFQVNNLVPALYIVGANAPAYISGPIDPAAPPTYYRIGDSVNVQLMRGGVITGSVTNAMGEPLVAVRVRATMIRDAKGQSTSLPFFGMLDQPTDDRGIYRLYGLAPGTYLVSAGGFSSFQTFQLYPYDSDIPTYAPSATRDNAAEVSVRSGEESNVDIRYRGDSGHIISGAVKTNSGNGAQVTLMPATGGIVMPGMYMFQSPSARGFAFTGISDGEYDLMAQEFVQTGPGPGVTMIAEPKRISVKGASVTGIELVPRPLPSVSGRVVLETSKVSECQGKRPPLMAETLVHLRRPEKDPTKENLVYQRQFGSSGSPDSNGAFVLRNLFPGKYQFDPRFYARYWYLQSITMGAATTTARPQASNARFDAAANWTEVKFGDQLTNLIITLAEGAASVRGKLTSTEPPPTGTILYLVPADPNKANDVLRFFVTDIAADGTFALNNLAPGRYFLLTQTNVDAQIATLTKLRQPEAATARAKLRRTAETQKTEIELKPCQNLIDYQLNK